MAAGRLAPDLEDEVGEAVDDGRGLVEAVAALDHPQRLDPALDAVEVAELLLERGKDRESDQPRCLVAGVDVELVARRAR